LAVASEQAPTRRAEKELAESEVAEGEWGRVFLFAPFSTGELFSSTCLLTLRQQKLTPFTVNLDFAGK